MTKFYQVIVDGFKGGEMTIDLCNTEEQMQKMTVLELKKKIIERLPGTNEPESLSLIFSTHRLDEDSKLLSSYGIQDGSAIHLVIKLPGGQRVISNTAACCH